jgi:hypothetical protein
VRAEAVRRHSLCAMCRLLPLEIRWISRRLARRFPWHRSGADGQGAAPMSMASTAKLHKLACCTACSRARLSKAFRTATVKECRTRTSATWHYFDFDKDVLRPESGPVPGEIAEALKANPALTQAATNTIWICRSGARLLL